MNNSSVQRILDECKSDLDGTKTIIDGLGLGSNIVPYLTNYAIIRACGAIELSFKSIIADYCDYRSKKQVKSFIGAKVRENACNPSYSRICDMVGDFDSNWHTCFKANIDANVNKTRIKNSLQSLVDARNAFAHGGNSTVSITDIIEYYVDSREVIEVLDLIIV